MLSGFSVKCQAAFFARERESERVRERAGKEMTVYHSYNASDHGDITHLFQCH